MIKIIEYYEDELKKQCNVGDIMEYSINGTPNNLVNGTYTGIIMFDSNYKNCNIHHIDNDIKIIRKLLVKKHAQIITKGPSDEIISQNP